MDLFDEQPVDIALSPGAIVLGGFARADGDRLIAALSDIAAQSPFRTMVTPGGWPMSVAMTNCGDLGWVADRTGYRYDAIDPETGAVWPAMPPLFAKLAARAAAAAAGYLAFEPDACLINRYEAGARLSLHQDSNERGPVAPIVSVSLGLAATFLWGGMARAERPRRVRVAHGDVVIWGGASRLAFHGVDPLRAGHHPGTGSVRYNLTFRRAG